MRALNAFLVALALAGCATSVDRYGMSRVSVGSFAFCEPNDWTLDWPQPGVPDLAARDRRDVVPVSSRVPDLASMRGNLTLDWPASGAPDLRAPPRADLAARVFVPSAELPPSRGAPWLPGTAREVPSLLAPERPDFVPRLAEPAMLDAPARPLDVGFGYAAATNEPSACTRALVLASNSCRYPARADLREPARRNP